MKIKLLLLCSLFLKLAFTQQFTSIEQSITNSFTFTEISEANNLALIGGVRVAKSVDQGFTWSEVNLGFFAMPWTIYTFDDASIISANQFFLVGNDDINHKAIVIKTEDGGQTWTNMLESANQSLMYFKAIKNNGSFINIAAKGGVYHSSDAGLNWSFISLSTSSQMEYMKYNALNNTWICGRSNGQTFYKSTNNGLSWTSVNFPVNLYGKTTQIGQFNQYFTINNRLNTSAVSDGTYYIFDQDFQLIASVDYSTELTLNNKIDDVFLLPDGNLIASCSYMFFKIDTLNHYVYHYPHHLSIDGNEVSSRDFEFDQTYGLAVGEIGGLSRLSLSPVTDLYIPAEFTKNSPSCPGDTLICESHFPYGDSISWYYDGNLISTSTQLEYPTPYSFENHIITCKNWYNGQFSETSKSVYFNPLNPPLIYNFTNSYTTPCFNKPGHLSGQLQGSWYSSGRTMDIWFGNQLMQHYSPPPSGSISLNTPNLTDTVTITVISSYTQTCGTSHDTTFIYFNPQEDLTENLVLSNPHDTICSGTIINFQLLNTNSTYKYEMLSNTWWQNMSTLYNGVNSDTLIIPGPNLLSYGYSPYKDYNFQVEITKNSCTQQFFLDYVTTIKADAVYYLHSTNYYPNDTLRITNALPVYNSTWEVSSPNLILQQEHDTVPLIYGTELGIHEVTLTNHPIANCIDNDKQNFRIADSLPNLDVTSCWQKTDNATQNLIEVKRDPFGNIYELGVVNVDNSGQAFSTPGYHLIKRNSNGDLLWEKTAPTEWGFYLKGAVIESIDFDSNGDVFCALWIQGDLNYTVDAINYSPYSSLTETRSYITKLDGETGAMVWHKDLTQNVINPGFLNYTRIRITDLIVDQDKIYFSMANGKRMDVYTMSMNGTYIAHDLITDNNGSGAAFSNTMYINTGSTSDDRETYQSPKMKLLPNGEIVCMAHYTGRLSHSSPTITELDNLDSLGNDRTGIMIMKYSTENGFYAFKKLASIPNFPPFYYERESIPMFDFDKDNNLYVAFSWYESTTPMVVCDSTLAIEQGTCIIKINNQFDLQWMTTANLSTTYSLDFAEQENMLYVAGKVQDNIAFSHDNVHLMMGKPGYYPVGTDSVYTNWELNYYQQTPRDFYISTFDSSGTPQAGLFLDCSTTSTAYSDRQKIKMSVSPCGEIIAAFSSITADTQNPPSVSSESVSFSFAQTTTLKLSPDCLPAICESATISYDSLNICSNSDSVYVSFSDSYQVDSVTYILDNGFTLDTVRKTTYGAGFYVSNIDPGLQNTVELTEPSQSSITIASVQTVIPEYLLDSTLCINENTTINASNTSLNYSWEQAAFSNQSSFPFHAYSVGDTPITVISMDNNNCYVHDTLTVHVTDVFNPNYPEFDYSDFNCTGDTILITANPGDYIYQWNSQSTSQNSQFSYTTNGNGIATIFVHSVDPLNCNIYDTLHVTFNAAINPGLNNSYLLNCTDTLIIPIIASNYTSQSWTNSGLVTENLFTASNLQVGLNEIGLSIVDTNGCELSVETEISFCVTGIAENILPDNSLQIIPNPNHGNFDLKLDYQGLKNVRIFSIKGEELYRSTHMKEGNIHLDLHLAGGVYLVQIVTEKGQFIQRMIVE